MIKDRLPDLVQLAQSDPQTYHEPELHEEVAMPEDLKVLLQRVGFFYRVFVSQNNNISVLN